MYDGDALARAVFADAYFYDGDAGLASVCAARREAAFDEACTVERVRRRYMGDAAGVAELVRTIKATDTRLMAYYSAAVTAKRSRSGT